MVRSSEGSELSGGDMEGKLLRELEGEGCVYHDLKIGFGAWLLNFKSVFGVIPSVITSPHSLADGDRL